MKILRLAMLATGIFGGHAHRAEAAPAASRTMICTPLVACLPRVVASGAGVGEAGGGQE